MYMVFDPAHSILIVTFISLPTGRHWHCHVLFSVVSLSLLINHIHFLPGALSKARLVQNRIFQISHSESGQTRPDVTSSASDACSARTPSRASRMSSILFVGVKFVEMSLDVFDEAVGDIIRRSITHAECVRLRLSITFRLWVA